MNRQEASDAPVEAEAKPLTTEDFERATDTPSVTGSGIYASGESHPDEDVSLSPPHEAAAQGAPGAAGAAKHETRADEAREEPHAALRPPTRQELTEAVEQPMVLPGLYRNGRLVVPAPLKGTREILIHQNLVADHEGLTRIQNDADLRRMIDARLLVNFPASAGLEVNPKIARDRRCARPWTVRFASDIARAYYAQFHEPLEVNSAARTVAYQRRLRRVNGNAAGISGDVASPHLTGEALDFGKRGMSRAEIAWMRLYLLPLMQSGKLDVEEEFQQACFHISVYRTYSPAGKQRSATAHEMAQLGAPHASKTASGADLNQ